MQVKRTEVVKHNVVVGANLLSGRCYIMYQQVDAKDPTVYIASYEGSTPRLVVLRTGQICSLSSTYEFVEVEVKATWGFA